MSNGELILYITEDGQTSIQLKAKEETVWLTQMELAALFQTSKQNISLHIKNILLTNELPESVVKDNLTTAADGKRYKTKLYNYPWSAMRHLTRTGVKKSGYAQMRKIWPSLRRCGSRRVRHIKNMLEECICQTQ